MNKFIKLDIFETDEKLLKYLKYRLNSQQYYKIKNKIADIREKYVAEKFKKFKEETHE